MKKFIFCLLFSLLSFASHAENFIGKIPIYSIYHPYTTGTVGSIAWVELIHALPSNVSAIQIFDTGGSIMKLGHGALGHETEMNYTIPVGASTNSPNTSLPFYDFLGDRIVIKSVVTGSVSTGGIIINFFQ